MALIFSLKDNPALPRKRVPGVVAPRRPTRFWEFHYGPALFIQETKTMLKRTGTPV